VDRCDRCGARAYVRVVLPNDLELLFCAHHGRQHAAALAKIAVEIRDEFGRLPGVAAQRKRLAVRLVRALPGIEDEHVPRFRIEAVHVIDSAQQ
jgi:hypothetical protein